MEWRRIIPISFCFSWDNRKHAFSIFDSIGADYFGMFDETLIEYRGSFCHHLRCRVLLPWSRPVTFVSLFVLFCDDDVVLASAFLDLSLFAAPNWLFTDFATGRISSAVSWRDSAGENYYN